MNRGLDLLDDWARTKGGQYAVSRHWATYDTLTLRITAISEDAHRYTVTQEVNTLRGFDLKSEVGARLDYMADQVVHEMWRQEAQEADKP